MRPHMVMKETHVTPVSAGSLSDVVTRVTANEQTRLLLIPQAIEG
jgi:hypothetical protein